MRVRLLGPVDMTVDGVSQPVRGVRRKAVLAVLALRAGEVVGVDLLIDAVWGGAAPPTGVTTVQRHVSYLRQILQPTAAVLAHSPGYVLKLGTDGTDVEIAEREIGEAARSSDPAQRAGHLRAALALWRGRSLVDVAGSVWLNEQAEHLERLRVGANRALIETRLALGEHIPLVPELERLAHDHPFDEQVYGQLMLALYRTGRQADALAVYRGLRHTLDAELGIAPSQPLRVLEGAILRQDPSLDLDPAAVRLSGPGQVPSAVPAPAQLPPALPVFVGRDAALARLDATLRGGTAMVLSVVSGTAGIGKTTLAVQWGHRVAARFPDGQLYVDLRGFDPARPPLEPAEAIHGFLGAWGVPDKHIPTGIEAQTALYRSHLAGRSVLLVLDNARDAAQVRPLLPGTPGCVTVVTSRNQLLPLVAAEGANALTLDLLNDHEASELLARRLGADRIAAEPEASAEVIARCARLPLALAVAAARAATHPAFPLAMLATELRDTAGGLDALHTGDTATDVRAVFACSYRTLSADAASLFRLLSLHPGPDVSEPAAASLASLPRRRCRRLLAELTRAHLLTEHHPGRYTVHDLLRAYATEQANTRDTRDARHRAEHRLLDHHLYSAHAAALLLNPQRSPIDLAPSQPGTVPECPATHEAALDWFTAERAVLLAAIERAATNGFDAHTWQLAWMLATFNLRQGHWQEHVAVHRTALDAARRLGDRSAQAYLYLGLAHASLLLGRLDDADNHYRHALDVYIDLDDQTGQAHIYLGLVEVAEIRGQPADGIRYAHQALVLYRAAGHQLGQASALNSVGWSHALRGEYQPALVYCRQALTLVQELGHPNTEAATWDSLGFAHHALAEHEQATTCYQHAVDLYRDLGDRYEEATSLTKLGDAHASHHLGHARAAWQRALTILAELAHPDADQVRARLNPSIPPERPDAD